MKTMIYNLQKRIFSAVFVLIISSVGFAVTKADGTPTSVSKNNSEAVKANNESVSPATGNLAESSAEASITELSHRIGEWLSDGSFWETDNSSEMAEKELAENIESWIADSSYWAVRHHGHNAEVKLGHKIKNWMNDGSYWETSEN